MADTKNYGLKGVGDDVQFGKAGGRFVFNTGASDFRATTDGTTLAHLQVLTPVGDTDAATKLYVDDTASGLDVKESVNSATTADASATYNATNGPQSNGQFTAFPATVDGVTLAENDRVLVKNQTNADENGIYIVTSTTTTLNRASDFDEDAEVTAGAFTFVEEGTVNADSGWVLQGPDPLTVGTGGGSDLNFVLFSTSSDIIAGDALTKTGNNLHLDFIDGGGLTNSVAIAGADEIAFADTGSSNAMQLRSMTNVIADLDITTHTGTPVDNQVAVWTGDGTLEGDANFTWDASTLLVNGTIAVNDAAGAALLDEAATATNPTVNPNKADADTGLGWAAADAPVIVAGGVEAIRFTEAGSSVIQTHEANVGLTADAGSAQGNGVITSTYNVYSVVATAGDAATLPAVFPVGTLVYVKNDDAAESMDVFPASGDDAGNGTNTAVVVAAGESATFIATTADATWSVLITEGGAGSVPTVITVADSTDTTSFPAFFESATGDLGPKTDASNYTYNATSGALTAGSYIGSNLTDNRVLIAGTSGLIEDDANFTFNGTTLALTAAMDITGDLDVDNININGDTISNTNTDSDITIQPNGTGSINLVNGSGEEILELNDTASAINGLAIAAGATGNPAQITTGTGSEANIDIGFLTNGTGVLSVVAGSGNYEDNVTAADDIPNKQYVDDLVAATGGSGTLDTIIGTVDLTTASTQNIGAAAGIPASCTIMSVTLEVDTASDAATTVTVGDATNGAASYMAASENDPEVLDIYIADGRVANAAVARQATATVASAGSTGSATCIITFRHV